METPEDPLASLSIFRLSSEITSFSMLAPSSVSCGQEDATSNEEYNTGPDKGVKRARRQRRQGADPCSVGGSKAAKQVQQELERLKLENERLKATNRALAMLNQHQEQLVDAMRQAGTAKSLQDATLFGGKASVEDIKMVMYGIFMGGMGIPEDAWLR